MRWNPIIRSVSLIWTSLTWWLDFRLRGTSLSTRGQARIPVIIQPKYNNILNFVTNKSKVFENCQKKFILKERGKFYLLVLVFTLLLSVVYEKVHWITKQINRKHCCLCLRLIRFDIGHKRQRRRRKNQTCPEKIISSEEEKKTFV